VQRRKEKLDFASKTAIFAQLKIFRTHDPEALAALQTGLAGSATGGANPLPEFFLVIRKHFGALDGKVQAAMSARLEDFPVHVRAPFTALPAEAVSPVRAKAIEQEPRDVF
jgi:4-hydroxy-tetrahydrodipicolinate synthase